MNTKRRDVSVNFTKNQCLLIQQTLHYRIVRIEKWDTHDALWAQCVGNEIAKPSGTFRLLRSNSLRSQRGFKNSRFASFQTQYRCNSYCSKVLKSSFCHLCL